MVPAEAVREEGGAATVFVHVNDGKVERRTVTLGRTTGGSRQVLTGVRDGERVVLSPPASLRDGDAVRVAESR